MCTVEVAPQRSNAGALQSSGPIPPQTLRGGAAVIAGEVDRHQSGCRAQVRVTINRAHQHL